MFPKFYSESKHLWEFAYIWYINGKHFDELPKFVKSNSNIHDHSTTYIHKFFGYFRNGTQSS